MRAVIRMAMRRATSPWLRLRMSAPSRKTEPEMDGSWPMMVLRMVDLPEPFGPMSVTILPRCTERATLEMSVLPL